MSYSEDCRADFDPHTRIPAWFWEIVSLTREMQVDCFRKLNELGIIPILGARFEPFTEVQVAEIEHKVGAVLPSAYRTFLLKYGASSFEESVICTSTTADIIWFGWFLPYPDMITAIEVKAEVLPKSIIPIGSDSGDNLFCLGVKDSDWDKVYFHHHTAGWLADAQYYEERGERVPLYVRYSTVRKISDSFESFILNMEREE